MSLISVVNGWQCEKCLVVKNDAPAFWTEGCDCGSAANPIRLGDGLPNWTKRQTKPFKMHYIMDGKYDLIFSVAADNAKSANLVANAELTTDGIFKNHILEFIECS